MKKRVVSVVLMMVLCLCLSTMAFAAESAEEDNSITVAGVGSAQASDLARDNQQVFSNVDLTDSAAVKAACEAYVREDAPDALQENDKVVVGTVVDVILPEDFTAGNEEKISFSAPDVKSSYSVYVYYLYMGADSLWQSVEATAGDGIITGTFRHLPSTRQHMPVMYIAVESAAAEQQPSVLAAEVENVKTEDLAKDSANVFADVDLKDSAAVKEACVAYVKASNSDALKENDTVVVGAVVEVIRPEGFTEGQKNDVTFPAPGVKPSYTVYVYHLKADGIWEPIPAKAGDASITGSFTSLSPVMYIAVQNAPTLPSQSGGNNNTTPPSQSGGNNNTMPQQSDPAKSPNTGAGSNAVLVAMFVMALGGAAWYGKKCFGNAR